MVSDHNGFPFRCSSKGKLILEMIQIRLSCYGGLAGLYYGYNAIPAEWIQALQKLDWIEKLLGNIQV